MSRKRNLTEAMARARSDMEASDEIEAFNQRRFFGGWRQSQPFSAPPNPYQVDLLVPNINRNLIAGNFGNAPTAQAQAQAQSQTPQASTNEETEEDEDVDRVDIDFKDATKGDVPSAQEVALDATPMGDLEEYDTLTGNLFGSGVSGRRRMNARRRMFY
jgi:hypothetical protein